MIALFSQYFLVIPYVSWTIAFLYTNLLTPKKWLKRPMLTLFLISIFVDTAVAIIKTYSITTGTNLLQMYLAALSICFFQEKLSRKLSCFLMFDIIGIAGESISTNLFIVSRSLITGTPALSYSDVSQITSWGDVLLMSFFNMLIGIIFYLKVTPLIKRCLSSLNLLVFLQLILTILIPTFAQGLIIYQTENPQFPLLSGIYWALCLICYPLFLLGLRSIKKQEKKRLFQQNQLEFMKEQLAFSKQSEEEYAALRKWNHDSENHLLAMSYLMDMGKYVEAQIYHKSMQ